LLFDDEDMLEVRYVLSLAHHDISIYGGGESIPEGELFIKRNAICLTRKSSVGDPMAEMAPPKPFFLFADNTSEKEDFYFAMLRAQEQGPDASDGPPVPVQFDVQHMIALIQGLHSSEDHLHTRWFNALLGRVFLSIYKTSDVESFIRAKITKKISRVKKPSFLSGITIKHISLGEGAPFISNPRLKDLTIDGDCVVEADVRYAGNFRLEIAATARLDLGTRFKAREVNLLLAVVLKKVEGHILVRIKPPPSNRLWMTFAQAPKIEMSIEPIVSSRQITYTVILRQIEHRIKEVIAESIVFPYWDDMAFYPTEGKTWRGGVWKENMKSDYEPTLDHVAEEGDVDEVEHIESENSIPLPTQDHSIGATGFDDSAASVPYPRKVARSLFSSSSSKASPSSSSISVNRTGGPEKPKILRQSSFTSTSSAVTGMDATNVDAIRAGIHTEPNHADSANAALSAGTRSEASAEASVTPRSISPSDSKRASRSSTSSGEQNDAERSHTQLTSGPDHDMAVSGAGPEALPAVATTYQPEYHSSQESISSMDVQPGRPLGQDRHKHSSGDLGLQSRHPPSTASSITIPSSLGNPANPHKRMTLTAVASAAASAKRWGMNALQRGGDANREHASDQFNSHHDLSQPIGRGRPLPPLGTPLPLPDRKTPTAPAPAVKRKPLNPPALPRRPQATEAQPTGPDPPASNHVGISEKESIRGVGPKHEASEKVPQLPPRQGSAPSKNESAEQSESGDALFIIAAPPESEPTTPMTESVPPAYPTPSADSGQQDHEK
jgi:hypothetical protein